jgi:phosphoglycerate dehydrogenase-like enzyme
MANEPPRADHPLLKFDNVVITPHVAAITDVAYRRMCVESPNKWLVLSVAENRTRSSCAILKFYSQGDET